MAQAKQVKASNIVIITLLIVIVAMGVFGWLYYKQLNPLETVKNLVATKYNSPQFAFSIYGNNEDPLKSPRYVYVQDNNVYVSDTGNGRIIVSDYKGKFVRQISQSGDKKGNLKSPYGLTIYNNQIYVADLGTNKISVFDMNGNFIKYFAESKIGRPVDVVYKNNKFYITDIGAMKIKIFDTNGKLIKEFGEKGTEKGQFTYPNGLAVDDQGKIYISDSNNNRIEVFDENGKLLMATVPPIDGNDTKNSQFSYVIPRGISVDKDGKIYMANTLANYVTISNNKGERIGTISKASDDDQDVFLVPNDTFIDGRGKLFVADSGNNRIVVYNLK